MNSARSAETSHSSAKNGSASTSSKGKLCPPDLSATKASTRGEGLENTLLWSSLREEDWEAVKAEVHRPETRVNVREESFGWYPAHFAANAGVPHVLKILVDSKAKLDVVDNEGNTPLMVACRSGHIKVVEFLVSKRADFDIQSNTGWTALIWSAINGWGDIANVLLGVNADLTKADNDGVTACMWAARYGHLEVVEQFLACGLNLLVCDGSGHTVLDHCNEHLQMASVIEAVHEVNDCLVVAAQRNNVEGVQEAIEAGADVDLRDGDGWTPIMWAALHASLDMVQLLVRYGATPSLLDEHGHVVEALQTQHLAVGNAIETILVSNDRLLDAAKDGDWQRVEEQLNNGAFINVRDLNGRTSLMWAAKHCSADAVHLLLSKSANVNDRDGFGWAAVHYAVIECSPESVSMFHFLGADMKVKTFEGDNLLHMAVRADDAVMIQLLLAAGLDTEDADVNLFTPLMMSAHTGLCNALQTLIAYGANIEAKSTEALGSRGALALAVAQGHEASVNGLLQPVRVPPKLPGEVEGEEKPAAKPKTKERSSGASTLKTGDTGKDSLSGTGKQVSAKAKAAAGGVAARRKAAPKAKAEKTEFRGDNADALVAEAIRLRGQQPWKDVAPPARGVVKQVDGFGNTSLSLAVQLRKTSIAMMILQASADLNAADDRGTTVLMHAVLTAQHEVVEIMLDRGAKIDKQDKAGQTAMDLCQDPAILQLLQRRIALGHVPPTDQALVDAVAARKDKAAEELNLMLAGFCVRLEGLPAEVDTADLDRHIRALLRAAGAPSLKQVWVAADPITQRPRGHAWAEFDDAVARDLALRGDGAVIEGYPIRVIPEPRRSAPA